MCCQPCFFFQNVLPTMFFFPECAANHVFFPQNVPPIMILFPACAVNYVFSQNVLPIMFSHRIYYQLYISSRMCCQSCC
jgi:hypothetical protein